MQRFFLLLCLLFTMTPAWAQEETDPLPLSGYFDVRVPASWEIAERNGTGYYWHSADSLIRIRTYSPDVQKLFGVENAEELIAFLVSDPNQSQVFNASLLQPVSFGDYPGFSYSYEVIENGESYPEVLFAYGHESGFLVMGFVDSLGDSSTVNAADAAALQAAMATVTSHPDIVFYEGTRLPIPSGWQVLDDNNYKLAYTHIMEDVLSLRVNVWPRYGIGQGLDSPTAFLNYIYAANYVERGPFDGNRLTPMQVAGLDAIFYPFDALYPNADNLYDRGLVVFSIPTNGGYVVAEVASRETDTALDEAFAVLNTLQPGQTVVCLLTVPQGQFIFADPVFGSETVRFTDEEVLIAAHYMVGNDGAIWYDIVEGWLRSDTYSPEVLCPDLPSWAG